MGITHDRGPSEANLLLSEHKGFQIRKSMADLPNVRLDTVTECIAPDGSSVPSHVVPFL